MITTDDIMALAAAMLRAGPNYDGTISELRAAVAALVAERDALKAQLETPPEWHSGLKEFGLEAPTPRAFAERMYARWSNRMDTITVERDVLRRQLGLTRHASLCGIHARETPPMPTVLEPMPNIEQQSLFDLPPPASLKKRTAAKTARSGTFTDNMKLPVHRWFRYSAGFSAEWAEQVIRELKPKAVLDPFAGSGTTLLAAESAGVMAIGYDSHPFVARIATAKTHWNQDELELSAAAKSVLSAAETVAPNLATVPDLLVKCYTPEALKQLYALRDAYQLCASNFKPGIAELIWLALTAVLRTCSFVGTAQWQYVLPNKRKSKSTEPFAAFTQKISDMVDDIVSMRSNDCRSDARIYMHDARAPSKEVAANSIDLVVTSPPYPNNYDYADATRLEMTFWDEIRGWGDLQEVVRQYIIRSCSQHATAEKLLLDDLLRDPSIEAIREELTEVCNELALVRQTKGGKKAYHTMIAAYFCDLAKVFIALRGACKAGSRMCFVIGDSAPYGVYVPAEAWLGRLAVAAGFKSFTFEKLRDRNIKWKNRKHRVPLHEGRLWIEG